MIKAPYKHLILKIIEKEEKRSKLILPKVEDHQHARVISVGPEIDIMLEIQPTIAIIPYGSGQRFEVNGQEYVSIHESQIIAFYSESE